MSKTCRMYFGTADDSTALLSVPPKDDLTQNELKEAMEGIVAANAFDGYSSVIKGVIYTSNTEILYEA